MQIDDIKLPLISCITDRNDINRTEKKIEKKTQTKTRKKERKKEAKKETNPE